MNQVTVNFAQLMDFMIDARLVQGNEVMEFLAGPPTLERASELWQGWNELDLSPVEYGTVHRANKQSLARLTYFIDWARNLASNHVLGELLEPHLIVALERLSSEPFRSILGDSSHYCSVSRKFGIEVGA